MNRWVYTLLVVAMAASHASGATFYVNKASTAGSQADGRSWAKAFTNIQPAIDAAATGGDGRDSVWVAEGTYGESRSANEGSLVLRPGVDLYGGFAGNETALNQRDIQARPTIIDGARSRGGSAAYHVVVGANSARLDGFRIVGGNANGGSSASDLRRFGGGLFNDSASPQVANCTFQNLRASSGGGAIYNRSSAPNISACVFTGNQGGPRGHAVFNINSSSAVFTDCSFDNNGVRNTGAGGAVYNDHSSGRYERCGFSGNLADTGGAFHNLSSSPTLRKCSFWSNQAAHNGGAIYNDQSSPSVVDTIFHGNSAVNGGAVYNPGSSSSFVNCVFQENTAGTFGGALYISASASFMNCTLWKNRANSGGSVYSASGGPDFTNCILWDGSPTEIAPLAGGVIVRYSDIEQDSGFSSTANIKSLPKFIGVGDNMLRLQPGSPCINKGTATGAPSTDYLDIPRSGGPDMGAYEGATCYLLTASAGNSSGTGVISPEAGRHHLYLQNTQLALLATPASNSRFAGWSGDIPGGSSAQNPLPVTMSVNRSVSARFIRLYTLTVQVVGGGAVNPAAGTHSYDSGAQVDLNATPQAGWQFDHWEGALTGSTPTGRVTMSADRSVTAVFVRTYTLTTAVQGGGTTTPSPGTRTYAEGTNVSVRAIANAGWRFDHWEGDATGSQNPVSVLMNGNRAVTAVFVQVITHTLTLGISGQGATDPLPGVHAYEENTSVTLTATPGLNWRFDHWEGSATTGQNPLSLVVDQDLAVTAVFVRIPLAIESAAPMAALPLGGTNVTLQVRSWADGCIVTINGQSCRIADVSGQGTAQVRVVVPPMTAGSYPLRVGNPATQEQATAATSFVYTDNPFDTGLPAGLDAGLEFDEGDTKVTTYARRIFRQAGSFPTLHYESPEGIVLDLPNGAIPSTADGACLLVRIAAAPGDLFPSATPLAGVVSRSGIVDWHLFVRETTPGGSVVREVTTVLPQALRIGLPISPGPVDEFLPAGFASTLDSLFAAQPPDPAEYADTGSSWTPGAGHLVTINARTSGAHLLFGDRALEDVNRDGEIDAVDVQLAINAALGIDIGGFTADIDGNGDVGAYDVQYVINTVLGFW